jgi:hypothetical protein
MKYFILIAFILLILVFLYIGKEEGFNIENGPLASAWEFSPVLGYGGGFGTGYSEFGIWPSNIDNEPWQPWMYGRMPRIFKTGYTPAPQIDYSFPSYEAGNSDANSFQVTNYKVDIINGNLAVNGVPGATLQIDKNKSVFFQIYTPGVPLMFSIDGINILPLPGIETPIENGFIEINFSEELPDMIYYTSPIDEHIGGIIYLNSLKKY